MPSEPPTLIDRVKATLDRHAMVRPGERILVAVSGGPDSVFLLHALRELGLSVAIGHFDHQTRNGESAADAEFVRKLALDNDLPLRAESRPVEREALDSPLSFEAYARGVRYEALIRMARELECAALATGHHGDDQAETVLMRLLRGTSPQGLAGIPPVRVEQGIRIIRPLLECSRDEVVEYLGKRGVSYRTDRSNMDRNYVRNRVRHDLIPRLRTDYNPNLDSALQRLSEIVRLEDELVDGQAREALDGCTDTEGAVLRRPFAELHPALQRRVVLLLAWRWGVSDCPFERVEGVRDFIFGGRTGEVYDLGEGVLLRNNRETTECVEQAPKAEEPGVRLCVPGETVAFGLRFRVCLLEKPPETDWARYCSARRQVFDADRIGDDLLVRRRRAGDRFAPLGLGGTKKLKDYFIDVGVPAGRRERQVLVVGDEKIVWVVGLAMGAEAAVTSDTKRILQIEVSDATED